MNGDNPSDILIVIAAFVSFIISICCCIPLNWEPKSECEFIQKSMGCFFLFLLLLYVFILLLFCL